AWLLDRCLEHARAHRHPELRDRTVADVFEDEKPALMRLPAVVFDGFHAVPASVSKTLLVRFDYNKYSVAARALGRPVEVQADADRVVIRQGDDIVAEHVRRFGRERTVYDPWHYVPVPAKKPGALRNGAPFKQLALPPSLERLRGRLRGSDDGDRQMVRILIAATIDGLEALEAAAAEALAQGVTSADVVLNILARARSAPIEPSIATPEHPRLSIEPAADAARHDQLLSARKAA
ncbi:Mu transposase domain-containing protein, partial [Amaricoccus sp. W119]|uniref:Mu transposase domain-containing protein n=1 Tax=Amaricoccus sp. W119 TaxID=3391833 RepID=UPI0039A5759A